MEVLLDHDAEDISQRLVECTRLVFVFEVWSILNHAMTQLMTDDIDILGEAWNVWLSLTNDRLAGWELTAEDLSVSITESHLVAIPEGVIHSWWSVVIVVMNTSNKMVTFIVDGVSIEDLRKECI
jgi:hypothetical protein